MSRAFWITAAIGIASLVGALHYSDDIGFKAATTLSVFWGVGLAGTFDILGRRPEPPAPRYP